MLLEPREESAIAINPPPPAFTAEQRQAEEVNATSHENAPPAVPDEDWDVRVSREQSLEPPGTTQFVLELDFLPVWAGEVGSCTTAPTLSSHFLS